jgi:lipopolysaccharide export system protein LptA
MIKKKYPFSRYFKYFIGLIFLIVLVVTLFNFISRSKNQPKILLSTDDIVDQKIDKKERIVYQEARGSANRLTLKAEQQYVDKDGLYHLKGNVEIIFPRKKDGEEISVFGEEITHDKELKNFFVPGNTVIKFKDLTVESSEVEYETERKKFQSRSEVTFSSERFSGSAVGFFYSHKQKKLILQNKARLKFESALDSPDAMEIEADTFEYIRKGRQGTAIGNVKLVHGKSLAVSDLLKFELIPTEEEIKNMFFKGSARASLVNDPDETAASGSQESLNFYSDRREIAADEIFIQSYRNTNQIQLIQIKGKSSIMFTSQTGDSTYVSADAVKIAFNQEGGLREFLAEKNAKLVEKKNETGEERIMDGAVITIGEKRNILSVRGQNELKAGILANDYKITADEIRIFLKNSNLEVKNGVEVVMEPVKKEKNSSGFFSEGKPIMITAEEMRYFNPNKRFLFSGKVKVWQEKKMLSSKELSLNKDSGRLQCTGGVRSTFPYRFKDGDKEHLAEINAGKMLYKPAENLILYETSSSLKLKELELRASSLFVYLEEGSGGIMNIIGKKNVVVSKSQNEGKGDEANIDMKKEVIVLVGNPVFTDKDKGKIKGEKLTFYMTDDKITIENKERARSVTVLKKSKKK